MVGEQRVVPSTGLVAVLAAATCFGTSGTVIKHIVQEWGLPPLTIAVVRIVLAVLFLLAGLAVVSRKRLAIQPRDIPFFLLFGFISVAVCQICWAYAIALIDVGVATVLNYTAPAWAALFAWPLLGERIDRQKGAALFLTLVGVALIARVFDARFLSINLVGLLFAAASGPAWGLYGIFGRRALRRYDSWTTLFYTFAAGALFLAPLGLTRGLGEAVGRPEPLLWLVFLALVPTVAGYGLYNVGLRHLRATVAAIVATIEPVVAAVLAGVVLGERLSAAQIAGATLIIAAVILLQLDLTPAHAVQPHAARADAAPDEQEGIHAGP